MCRLASFVKRAVRPAVSRLDDEADLAAFQTIDDVVFVARLDPRDAHLGREYARVAAHYRDRATFGAADVRAGEPPAVVCHANADAEQRAVADLSVAGALEDLVAACLAPLVGELTRASETDYLQAGKSLVYYFFSPGAVPPPPSPSPRDAYVDAVRPLAKKYRDYLSFVTVDADEYPDMAPALGLPAGRLPALAVQNPSFGQAFPFRGAEISAETVDHFVLDIVEGKVPPWAGEVEDPPLDRPRDEL